MKNYLIDSWQSIQLIMYNAQKFQVFNKPYFLFFMLQWLGDDKLRRILEGKLVLIHLVCKKESNRSNVSTSSFPGSTLSKDTSAPKRQIFRPCLALRIAGSPGNELWYYIFTLYHLIANNKQIIYNLNLQVLQSIW